jgi:hypothetical protein
VVAFAARLVQGDFGDDEVVRLGLDAPAGAGQVFRKVMHLAFLLTAENAERN